MGFLELRHVDGDHVALTAIQHISQGKSSFGFTHTTGADQHKNANRFFRIVQISSECSDPPGNGIQGLTLTHHALRQPVFQVQDRVNFIGHHFAHRYPRPARNHFRHSSRIHAHRNHGLIVLNGF